MEVELDDLPSSQLAVPIYRAANIERILQPFDLHILL